MLLFGMLSVSRAGDFPSEYQCIGDSAAIAKYCPIGYDSAKLDPKVRVALWWSEDRDR